MSFKRILAEELRADFLWKFALPKREPWVCVIRYGLLIMSAKALESAGRRLGCIPYTKYSRVGAMEACSRRSPTSEEISWQPQVQAMPHVNETPPKIVCRWCCFLNSCSAEKCLVCCNRLQLYKSVSERRRSVKKRKHNEKAVMIFRPLCSTREAH